MTLPKLPRNLQRVLTKTALIQPATRAEPPDIQLRIFQRSRGRDSNRARKVEKNAPARANVRERFAEEGVDSIENVLRIITITPPRGIEVRDFN